MRSNVDNKLCNNFFVMNKGALKHLKQLNMIKKKNHENPQK